MGGIVRMVVVLSLICGLAGFTLSFLSMSMAPLIEEQVLTYVQEPAIKSVFGDVENNPVADRRKFELPDGGSITLFPAMRGGKRYVIINGVETPYVANVHGYNTAPDNYVLTPNERTSLFAQGTYNVTDNVMFRTEAMYNERKSEQLLAAMPVTGFVIE